MGIISGSLGLVKVKPGGKGLMFGVSG